MVRSQHLLDLRQHGFLPKKSCTTQMVSFVDSLAQTINESSRTDVVYFDFMKAFDSVNHDLILSKLKHQYKIEGRLLKFMVSYLQDRVQRVVIDGIESTPSIVQSGVPQGSILGPLLFVLFINDIFSCTSSGTEISLYADDTKIWRRIDSWNDHVILQNNIDALHNWSILNKMKFHPLKCKVLRVTLNQIETYQTIPLPFCIFNYSLNGVGLDYVDAEKDLGIMVTSKLSWNDHCMTMYSKASSRLGLVKRTCHFVTCQRQKRALYLSLVRSLFEHACVVWRPCSDSLLTKLEKIQRRAVKWILSEQDFHYNDLEYSQKLIDLDLLPLLSRFKLNDLILFHKIYYNMSPIRFPHYINITSDDDLMDTRLRSKIKAPTYLGVTQATVSNTLDELRAESILDHLSVKITAEIGVQLFARSFFIRTSTLWNRLPVSLRAIKCNDSFKIELSAHLRSKMELILVANLEPD